jgi:hypothetical protein
MRLALAAAVAAGLAFAGPAAAVTVETKIAPEFQEKLEDDYGVREAGILSEALVKKIETQLASKGAKVDRVVVTIHDAKPNRPTMEQVSEKMGLDPIRSISVGGAKVSGVAYDASGKEVGSVAYDWYETDIRQVLGSSTWHDARWAFDRFARKLAKQVG